MRLCLFQSLNGRLHGRGCVGRDSGGEGGTVGRDGRREGDLDGDA